jgi:hypothetical protein
MAAPPALEMMIMLPLIAIEMLVPAPSSTSSLS